MPLYRALNAAGASFVHVSLTSAGATTLIAAATNVRGLIIRSMAFDLVAVDFALYHDTAAPTGINDLAKFKFWQWEDAKTWASPHLPLPYLIPAGDGLFAYTGGAGSPVASIGYNLL